MTVYSSSSGLVRVWQRFKTCPTLRMRRLKGQSMSFEMPLSIHFVLLSPHNSANVSRTVQLMQWLHRESLQNSPESPPEQSRM
jgi:hypothetical protein